MESIITSASHAVTSNIPADAQIAQEVRNPEIDVGLATKLWKCMRGDYPCLWYQLKRFESLSLLNLYHYQQEIVNQEMEITKKGRGMFIEECARLRVLMKEYRKYLTSQRR
jgi:hypothetical protein